MLPRPPAVPAPRDHRTESYLSVTFLTNSPRPRWEPPEVRDGVRCPHVSSASIGHRRGTPGSLDKRLVSARMSRWAPAAEGCWVNGARFLSPLPRCSSPRPVLRVAASGRRCRTERYVPPDPAAHSRCLQTDPQPRAAGPWGPRPVREAESGTPALPSTSDPKRPQASPSSGPGSLPKTRRGQRAASSHGISLPSAKVGDEGSQPLANNARFMFFSRFLWNLRLSRCSNMAGSELTKPWAEHRLAFPWF